jgi:hypothetical protein
MSPRGELYPQRPPLVGEVSANFCSYRVPRGQCDGSLRSYSWFSRPEQLFLISSSSSILFGVTFPKYVVDSKSSQNLIFFLNEQWTLPRETCWFQEQVVFMTPFRGSFINFGIVVIYCQLFLCSYGPFICRIWKCRLQHNVRIWNCVVCCKNFLLIHYECLEKCMIRGN